MKITDKELLELMGIKVGDNIIIEGKLEAKVIAVNGKYLLCTNEFDYNVVYLINKEYEIVKPPILTYKEKEYLSAIIKPFRDKIVYIQKVCINELEFIYIELNSINVNETEEITLPYFPQGTMYKGMEKEKKYSLEELGL